MALILVTGSKGQLGSELRKISHRFFGYDFIFTDIDTLDITDAAKSKEFILSKRPEWIINCAAYNYVDRAEDEKELAFKINSEGVKNITEAIKDTTCRLIHLSTDYVFDGNTKEPYKETDPPNPLSVYAASKLEGEKHALKHSWSIVIRTSWLYSVYGNNFVKTIIRKAKENGHLKVVNDQKGSPTWAADLADAIMKIISDINSKETAFNGGIYHYSNQGACTWFEFAQEILKLSGIECTIEPVTTKDFPAKAVRPCFSVLSKKKIIENYGITIPAWDESLKKCIKQMKKENIIFIL
ncbi:MAG TPA: dTDP-4-dehydrorhamnose reductase [Bacteroidales bacterium]|mgnify:CR=1 FL=1|nr:dTDP-4-dehydrorhamnose reductase [Bacteroidales bacterium]HOK75894.1 dTDP-4-dehydrorhamnose reductase [Bacteroidales bacterium]HOM41374.1 dTDP-4-dehydrorhamnose reductase [Bacteroidales bacterium]HPP92841.1 dTDP-4-dehydrorhamnose reductase [Bacteroidales bacterium]HQG56741.1 dTDP-4-dehydrorhamnose reductase [Bacteroidales bacterium]